MRLKGGASSSQLSSHQVTSLLLGQHHTLTCQGLKNLWDAGLFVIKIRKVPGSWDKLVALITAESDEVPNEYKQQETVEGWNQLTLQQLEVLWSALYFTMFFLFKISF